MNISMFVDYALEQASRGAFATETEALRHFYNKGVRYADIVNTEFEAHPFGEYCELIRNAGLVPRCLVSTLNIASADPTERAEAINESKHYIEKMHEYGIPLFMPAPDVRPARSKAELEEMRELLVEGVTQLCEYAKSYSVTVAIENQSTLTRADSRISDIEYLLASVDGLKYIFDVGNYFCVMEDAVAAYERLKDKLVHIHIKDWGYDDFGPFLRECLPRFDGVVYGEGVVPIKELLLRFKRDGREESLVLEYNSDNITLGQLDACAEYLRREICGE